ncbi:MAG TPA: adenylosuccinate synthetase [Nitrososphaerales archaeon]
MPAYVIVGGFFGDEGKGKIVAYLALNDKADTAVRGGVGPNAGHTVIHQGKTYKLRMLPSAIVSRAKLMVGAGVLVNPDVLLDEAKMYDVKSRVLVDYGASIIEEKHLDADRVGHLKEKIGTTGTGTGPANSDRVLRVAKIARDEPKLKGLVGDVAEHVNGVVDAGKNLIVEGTQGTFLSLYHGTYPYVTSKDVTASAICSDVGLGPKKVDDVIMVCKAYVTRVGSGELDGELSAEEVQKRGWQEFGTVTGRLRRAAPFSMKLAKRAAMLNSATGIAITKFDILFPETANMTNYAKLTSRAKKFVEEVEGEVGVPVVLIGTGAEVSSTVDRRKN